MISETKKNGGKTCRALYSKSWLRGFLYKYNRKPLGGSEIRKDMICVIHYYIPCS